MVSEDDIPARPLNPVRIGTKREEDLHELQSTGVVFDSLGQQYRYRTNEDLSPGETYEVDVELIVEKTVRVTDSWNDIAYR